MREGLEEEAVGGGGEGLRWAAMGCDEQGAAGQGRAGTARLGGLSRSDRGSRLRAVQCSRSCTISLLPPPSFLLPRFVPFFPCARDPESRRRSPAATEKKEEGRKRLTASQPGRPLPRPTPPKASPPPRRRPRAPTARAGSPRPRLQVRARARARARWRAAGRGGRRAGGRRRGGASGRGAGRRR